MVRIWIIIAKFKEKTMANKNNINVNPRGVHVSPGIYTNELELTYAAKSLGITTLGVVGETVKGPAFQPIDTPAQDINYSYLNKLFTEAIENNPISKETLDKVEEMDNYVIQHFRIAFGNRIVMHMKKFVPVYVACGGDEVDGVDYFIAKKILRKFEQLNVSYIRDEIDGFVEFLDKQFGKGKMKECEEYVLRLKKLT